MTIFTTVVKYVIIRNLQGVLQTLYACTYINFLCLYIRCSYVRTTLYYYLHTYKHTNTCTYVSTSHFRIYTRTIRIESQLEGMLNDYTTGMYIWLI